MTLCSKSKPYPAACYTASPHDQSRMKLCVICMALIPRKHWEDAVGKQKLHIPDSASLQKKVESLLPGYDAAVHSWMPTSLCRTCRRRQNSDAVAHAVERLTTDKVRQVLAVQCDGRMCDICRTVNEQSVSANRSTPPKPTKDQSFRYEIVAALMATLAALHLVVPEPLLYLIASYLLFCTSAAHATYAMKSTLLLFAIRSFLSSCYL